MSNLLSELEMAMWRIDNRPADYASMMSVGFLRTHHAEIAAAVRDAAALRDMLRNTVAIAVTQLFATHAADVVAAFTLAELQRISELSAPLADANVSVEAIYREAWGAAMSAREGE